MLVWKFLHILSMFAGVTLLFTYEIVVHRAAAAGEVMVVRAVATAGKPSRAPASGSSCWGSSSA